MQDIGEIYSNAYENAAAPKGWLRRHSGHLLLALGILGSIGSTGIIISSSGDFILALIYLLSCITCLSFLFICRKDILSPIAIATIWYSFAFLCSVPCFTAVKELMPIGIIPSSSALSESLGLSLIGLLSFTIGSISGFQVVFRPILRWITRPKSPLSPAGPGQFICVLIWLFIGTALRLYFDVGRAREDSSIKLGNIAGLIQFAFNDGSLVLIGLFFYRVLERPLIFIVEGYLLLLGYTTMQLLLGWKSAILGAFILLMTLLWYQAGKNRQRSLMWALVMIVFIPITMQIGYAVRSRYSDGVAQAYSEGKGDFILKVIMRLDGHGRFAKMLQHENAGKGISLTNGFKLIELHRMGIDTMEYADIYVHEIALDRKTSTGASGPGGAYIAMGLLGIILGYFLLGAIYRSVYKLINTLSDPSLAIVLYGMLIIILRQFFVENFRFKQLLKRLFVISILMVLSRCILKNNSNEQSQAFDR